jgi:hypothetical protein
VAEQQAGSMIVSRYSVVCLIVSVAASSSYYTSSKPDNGELRMDFQLENLAGRSPAV